MSLESTQLTVEEILKIAQKDDFHVAPFRDDGKSYGTPTWIWCVQVENNLYVRAYNGSASRWYQAAMKQKAGKIVATGMEKKVQFEAVTGAINEKIDDAYCEKYSDSPYLGAMISNRAKAATVRVF